ncbi:hypothetical protein M5K25_022589 [Dendrobium thyrsiflorum]|uniref:Uncharacterized protein n=1 Tax=Dendrobium thyrsiflorum TaxID=117978 RepID=A0ABD0U6G5_DENTH
MFIANVINVRVLLHSPPKMEGGLTFCNMFIKATGKTWVAPAYEFPFNYFEDKTSVEYEPVCSDTDERSSHGIRASSLIALSFPSNEAALCMRNLLVSIIRTFLNEAFDFTYLYLMLFLLGKFFVLIGLGVPYRFIRDYRFDVSKLETSAAKRKKVEVPTYLTQITHKAWMDKDIASKSLDQVERFVPGYLRKLGVILVLVLVELLAWVFLETLTLTLLHLRTSIHISPPLLVYAQQSCLPSTIIFFTMLLEMWPSILLEFFDLHVSVAPLERSVGGHAGMCLYHKQEFSWQDGSQKTTDLFTLHSCSISIYTPVLKVKM